MNKLLSIFFVLALALPAYGVERRGKERRHIPAFELLPAGGGVTHVLPVPLDELFADEMTGNWFALHGDGTTAGTVALSAVGSPTTQTDRVCPSGPDCESVSGQRMDGTDDAYKTADIASPTGDVSCWAVVRQDDIAAGYMLVSKDSNEANNRALEFSTDTSGRVRFDVYKTDGSASSKVTASNTVIPGLVQFFVGTYDFVTDGTSVSTVYIDGSASGAAVTTAVGPLQAAASTFWGIGYREYGGAQGFRKGNVLSAGCTEKVLSAATITAMNTAVQAQLQGSRGETVTTTRTTVRSCTESASQTGSLLAASKPCVRDGALSVWAAHTNLAFPSETLDTWTAIGTPTESANAVVGPLGTLVADTIGDDDAAAAEGERMAPTVSAGAAHTLSCYIRAGTSSAARLVLDGTSCDVTPTSSWARYSCTDTSSSGTSINADVYPTDATVSSTGTIHVFGCQVNTGSVAAPYCPTTTASATCNADVVSVSTTGWPNAAGEIRLTFTPSSTTGNQYLLDSRSADNTGFALLVSSSTLIAHMGTAGSATTVTSGVLSWTAGTAYAIRVRWGGGNIYVYRDEALVASNVTGTANMPTHHSTTKIGSRYTDTEQANGLIHSLEVRP